VIRVLNIISDTNIGGAGRVILNYLRYSDKNHFETMVAIPGTACSNPRWKRRASPCMRWTAWPTAPMPRRM